MKKQTQQQQETHGITKKHFSNQHKKQTMKENNTIITKAYRAGLLIFTPRFQTIAISTLYLS